MSDHRTPEELLQREQDEEAQALAEIDSVLVTDPYSAAEYAVAASLSGEFAELVYRKWRDGALAGEALEKAVWAAWTRNPYPAETMGHPRWVELFEATGFIGTFTIR